MSLYGEIGRPTQKGPKLQTLRDLEELIGSVKEPDIADYLNEAYRCYGAGAYRATIVITNIALFDGLFAKIKALAPVSKVCKEVVDEIGPLQSAQKVFELPLVHKLKSKKVITEFEAQRLEQLINHRNKAAHPSGHHPSAEEARFVFTDAISVFLAKPVRQTAYLVSEIKSKLNSDNLFPSSMISDTKSIVEGEVENLDDLAIPFLIAALNDSTDNGTVRESANAKKFLKGFVSLRKEIARKEFARAVVKPRLSSKNEAQFVSELCCCDPKLIEELSPSDLIQLDSLLVENAKAVGVDYQTNLIMSPTQLTWRFINLVGEEHLGLIPDFRAHIVKAAPLAERFISALANAGDLRTEIEKRYIEIAGSSTFDTANRFARRMSDLDDVLAEVFSPETVFKLIANVVCAANTGAFAAIGVAEKGFSSCPKMREYALSYSKSEVIDSEKIVEEAGVSMEIADFRQSYLGD